MKDLPETITARGCAIYQAQGHPTRRRCWATPAAPRSRAADALGIAVGQVAKGIIFRRKDDDAAVLVITSGDRRVDEKKVVAWWAYHRPGRCAVREGAHRIFHWGCLARCARHAPRHADRPRPAALLTWCGCSQAPAWRVPLHPGDLQRLTGAPVVDVAQEPAAPWCY